jgi:Fic family protein
LEKLDEKGINMKKVSIWNGINFNNSWSNASTDLLDVLLTAWERKREQFSKDTGQFDAFFIKLKRTHAIETGIVEKLYDLSRGVTETFIKDGFNSSLLSHGDTNIEDSKLISFLTDHYEAIDYIFDLVKDKRDITAHVIKEIHQFVAKSQDYTEAKDQFGSLKKVKFHKGIFKVHPNNPVRDDGTLFEYCPPEHTISEIERLIQLYKENEGKVSGVILAAWFHHAFTQIHPFQDGNGRVARLLSSFILIKNNLFPFTVLRGDRDRYILALEKADKGDGSELVSFMAETQANSIHKALNHESTGSKSLSVVFGKLADKIHEKNEESFILRKKIIDENLLRVFDISEIKIKKLVESLSNETFELKYKIIKPNDEKSYYFTKEIISAAKFHDYYFNKNYPRGWFSISVCVGDFLFHVNFSIHFYGHADNVIALTSFIREQENDDESHGSEMAAQYQVLEIKPLILSLEFKENDQILVQVKGLVESYIADTLTIAVARVVDHLS